MINPMSINGKPAYGVNEYVCDTTEDVKKLPTGCAPGSTAYDIETGDVYILNGLKKWVKMK